MKRFLVASIIAIGLIAGNVSAAELGENLALSKVQKLYLTGTSSEFNIGKYKEELSSVRKWDIEGRAKVEVVRGIGFDTSILYPVGSKFDDSTIRAGVFYQPAEWVEVAYSTSFGVDRFQDFGDVSIVSVSIGKGF